MAVIIVISSFHAINSSWIRTNRVLAALPIQRFKWKSETFLSSAFNRTASLVSSSIAFTILIYAHFVQPDLIPIKSPSSSFFQLLLIVVLFFLIKLVAMKLFFTLHEEDDIGTKVIDYQYAFNQLLSLFVLAVLCFDVFIFRLSTALYITLCIIIALVFLLRLLGNILMLLNNFNYPIVSLFIYLCAFEIIPMLVVAKVLFDYS